MKKLIALLLALVLVLSLVACTAKEEPEKEEEKPADSEQKPAEDKKEEDKKEMINDGVLFCSGMIAGEGLVGILLALFAVFGINQAFDLSAKLGIPTAVSEIGSLVLFAIIILTTLKFSLWKKRK